jgi:hypothetical protein
VRVVEVQLHFTVLVEFTFAELLKVELLIAHATPSTVLPTGSVPPSPPDDEQADRAAIAQHSMIE